MSIPETRPSLLLRIRDNEDCEAWNEFSSIYRPVVYRLAIQSGMQPADADDLAQSVLLAISKAIDGFEPNSEKAMFRTWLKTIAKRAIINAITRRSFDQATGGSNIGVRLSQTPEESDITRTLTLNYRREIFRVAAMQIRCEFTTDTWDAFWQSVVVGTPVSDIAQATGKSLGSIYTARSRVMRRLRSKVKEIDLANEDIGS